MPIAKNAAFILLLGYNLKLLFSVGGDGGMKI